MSALAPSPIWGTTGGTTIGPFTLRHSNGKYMYFNTVDNQEVATTYYVTLSDTPQKFLWIGPVTASGVTQFGPETNYTRGVLFPFYRQTNGSLWAYAVSGYDRINGNSIPGSERSMVLAPFTQTQTNWNQPFQQSFSWQFRKMDDGTFTLQNAAAGYTGVNADGSKILLGSSASSIDRWTIEYPSSSNASGPPYDAGAPPYDAGAPAPASGVDWILVAALIFIILLCCSFGIVLLMTFSGSQIKKSK